MMKAYEFLDQFEGHDIADATGFNADFTKETGLEPCWPNITVKETREAIDARGLGGHCPGQPKDTVVWLYVVAGHLARKYCGSSSGKMGRGSGFRDNIRILKENDI